MPSGSDKAGALIRVARTLAAENAGFEEVLGPGAGDQRVHRFMRQLRKISLETFGHDFSEKKICGKNALAVDFYFPDETTIVEIALGLPNPSTEFEKDVLKAIMAQECGSKVNRLLLVSRPGGVKKCTQPGRRAIID